MLFNKSLIEEEVNKKPQLQAVPAHRAYPSAEWAAVAAFHRCAVHKHTTTSGEIHTAHLRQQVCVQKGGRGEGNREATSDIFMSRNFTQASDA